MMASFVRLGIIVISFAVLLFSTSCEKHPLGQMPEVQREQPDPAKAWSHNDNADTKESQSSAIGSESSSEAR
jgi:hypothetical protein